MQSPSPAEGAHHDSATSRIWQSRLGRGIALALLWVVLALISAAQNAAWREMEWPVALTFATLDWGPWVLLSPLVLWYARRVQIDGHNWQRTVPLHLLGALVIAFAAQLIAQTVIDARVLPLPEGGFGPPRPPPPAGATDRGPGAGDRQPPPGSRFIRARFSIPIYCVLVAAAHAVAYHRRSLERERRALHAEARLTEARLMALQTQLNPHFLFNTLNTISSLVYTQPQAADEMLCSLSELLRRALAIAERREVTLAEEMEFIDRYVSIQRIRFADRLQVRRDIGPGLERAAVPTLLLQPLVENAIVHGVAPHTSQGIVTIRAMAQGTRLVLTVSDTGGAGALAGLNPGDTPPVTERVGLSNTRARLVAMYGADAQFTLTRAVEGGLCARIDLPLRRITAA